MQFWTYTSCSQAYHHDFLSIKFELVSKEFAVVSLLLQMNQVVTNIRFDHRVVNFYSWNNNTAITPFLLAATFWHLIPTVLEKILLAWIVLFLLSTIDTTVVITYSYMMIRRTGKSEASFQRILPDSLVYLMMGIKSGKGLQDNRIFWWLIESQNDNLSPPLFWQSFVFVVLRQWSTVLMAGSSSYYTAQRLGGFYYWVRSSGQSDLLHKYHLQKAGLSTKRTCRAWAKSSDLSVHFSRCRCRKQHVLPNYVSLSCL